MQITGWLHLVLSGAMGFDLTNAFDCNVFMLKAGEDWILFDSGAGIDEDETVKAVEATGIPTERIRHLFLTHAHADHAGGAAILKERLGVHVYAGAQTAAMVQTGDEHGNGLARARDAGIYPADYTFRATGVDTVLAENEQVSVNSATVTMFATPGHSADHVSYLVTTPDRNTLIAGDALFCGGRVVIQDIPDCNIGDICASVRKLAALDYDVFLPGHFNFSLKDGSRHADAAMKFVNGFQCPPSMF
ncbi:MAG: MBL fold metallo-hydrolase [Alphaproteobacteria bacterium]|nr:MBL fold metallo-hydrolase [Alphaproteobacteria bacterium]